MHVKLIASMFTNRGLKVHATSDWTEAEDGDIDLGNGYHVQVGDDYLCLTKNRYDHDGEIQAIRFILEDATVEAIIRYFEEKE